MMEIGEIIKWKERESLLGLMRESTKEIIMMTKRKGSEYSIGQMGGNTKENGRMENNMELEFTLLLQEKQEKVNGLKATA